MRRFALLLAFSVLTLSFTFQALHSFAMAEMSGTAGCEHAANCALSSVSGGTDCLEQCLSSGLPDTFFAQFIPQPFVLVMFVALIPALFFLGVIPQIRLAARDAPFGKFDLHKRWASVMIKS